MTALVLRKIFSNLGWNSINELLVKGAILLGNLYLARTLGPDSYGFIVLSQTTVMFLWMIIDMGVSVYGLKEVSQYRSEASHIFNEVTSLRIFLATIVFTVYVTVIGYFGKNGPLKDALIVNGLLLFLYPLCADWVLKGLERFNALTSGTLAFALSYLGGVVLWVRDDKDVIAAVWIWIASHAVLGCAILRSLNNVGIKFRPRFVWKAWTRHIRESISFAMAGWASAAYHSLPVLLIGQVFSSQLLGLFSAPFRIISALSAPGFYISTVYYPRLANLYVEDKRAFGNARTELCIVLSILGAVVAGGMYIFREQVCSLLLGTMYSESRDVLGVLVLTLPIVYLQYGLIASLWCTERQKFQAIPYLIGLFALAGLIGSVEYVSNLGAENILGLLAGSIVVGELLVLTTYGVVFFSGNVAHSRILNRKQVVR